MDKTSVFSALHTLQRYSRLLGVCSHDVDASCSDVSLMVEFGRLFEIKNQKKLNRLIHLSGRLLDEEDFPRYAALFADDREYRLVAEAPEVKRLNRQELDDLLASAPKRVWPTGQRSHLISIEEVEVEGDTAHRWAAFSVFHTDSEGATTLYAVGRYEDRWQKSNDDWRLRKRVTHL